MNLISVSKKKINVLLFIFVLIDTILLFISTFSTLPADINEHIFHFDIFVCVILWIEFIYNLYYSENRLYYLKKNWYYIIAMIPLDFFFLRAFGFARILRLLRLTRTILLITKGRNSYKEFAKTTNLDKLLIAIVIFTIVSTVALYTIEPNFGSLFETFWYVIVTLTSVGYGDVVPVTQNGKILAFVIIIVGIIFFSVFTAAVASIYIRKVNESSEYNYEKHLNNLKLQIDEIIKQLQSMEEDYHLKVSDELDEINAKIDNLNKEISEISKKIDD